MKINISDVNYHIGELSHDEIVLVRHIYGDLLLQYPDLSKQINKYFEDSSTVYSENLILCILTAFIYSLKDRDLNKEQVLKTLKTYINVFLPIILENINEFNGSRFIQFEPKIATLLSLGNYLTKQFIYEYDSLFSKSELNEFERYYYYDFIALGRVIKSSIVLFSIGDDVHAIGLYRAAIELFANINLADKNKEDYVKFKKYNIYLQLHKIQNDPLPKEMTDYLGKYAKDENYIKYGWAINEKGKRSNRMADFIDLAFGPNKQMDYFIHLSSEFIHEDYNGVPYDYIQLRRDTLNLYYLIGKESLECIIEDKKKYNKFIRLIEICEKE